MIIALAASAAVSLLCLWLAIASYRRLAARDREFALLRRCNIDLAGYGVPDAQVDNEAPVTIDVAGTFVLVETLNAERMDTFIRDYLGFLGQFSGFIDQIAELFTSPGSLSPETIAFLRRQDVKQYCSRIIKRAILKNPVMNPNKVSHRTFLKEWSVDRTQRILFALFEYNLGAHFKKKLEFQRQAILQHLERDLLGPSGSSGSPTKSTVAALFPDSPFLPPHLRAPSSAPNPTPSTLTPGSQAPSSPVGSGDA